MANIAVYVHHPYCSWDSAAGFVGAMDQDHSCTYFDVSKLDNRFLNKFDMVVFPGGLGDVDIFDSTLKDKIGIIQNYVDCGGKYLGICMGAYWTGEKYFNLIEPEPIQYIKQNNALTARSYGTVLPVIWENKNEHMFFYDGCTFEGNFEHVKVLAYYDNHDEPSYDWPAAIIEGNVGAIGPHPESNKYWYNSWSYMPQFWHRKRHHKLLKKFVKEMLG
jgi:glutamine amidotransferase-like uncharacterized protein